jgi:exonuclease VII large subunit
LERDQTIVHLQNSARDARDREISIVQKHNASLLEEQNNRVSKLEQGLQEGTAADMLRRQQQTQAAFIAERRAWRAAVDVETNSVKDQYDASLKTNMEQMKKYSMELDEFKQATNKQLESYRSEIRYLYDYIARVTLVLENIDST